MKNSIYSFFAKVVAVVAVLFLFASSAWGDSYSYTFSSNAWTENGSATLNNVSWTLNMSGGTISSFSSTQGMHFGTNNSTCNSVEISTSGINGTVTSVAIEASRGSNLVGDLSVSVGGTVFSTTSSTSLTTSNASYVFTGSKSGTINIAWTKSSGKGAFYIKSITVTYSAAGANPTCAAPSFSPSAGAVLSGTTVTLSTTTEGASIYYTKGASPADPTTGSTLYSSPISVTEATTIKAIAVKDGMSNSSVASASYTILEPLTTMDEIFAKASSVGAPATTVAITFDDWVVTGVKNNNAYVSDGTKGFIIYQSGHGFSVGDVLSGTASCKVQLFNGSSEITSLTSTTNGLTVTGGGVVTPVSGVSISSLSGVNTGAVYSFEDLSYDGTNLSDGVNEIKPYTTLYSGTFENGKSYNVTGVYLQYNSTKELLPRSAADIEEIVPSVPTINVSTSSLSGFTYVEGSGPSDAKSFTVSGSNLTANISLSMSGSDYEMSLSEGDDYTTSLSLTQTAGEVTSTPIYVRLKADKSAGSYSSSTITLSSTGADNKTVSLSGTVTEYVAPYATLPFAFDNGRDNVAGTAGLTQDGLGTDYGSSPKLKFDGTGDYLILQINERPGVLTFDIIGNGFSQGSTSTFKVQTSADGISYVDLETYTSLNSSTETKEFNNLAATVRYIKWVYAEKGATYGGNVALGNISLAVYTPPVPTITVTPTSVAVDAEAVKPATEIEGTLAITYENLTISDFDDFDIEFCDSEGNALGGGEEPSWIAVLTAEDSGDYLVSYVIEENASYDARSAYFKVYALDDESNIVRSSLITITQNGLPAPALGYAALPFEFTGKKADIASTDGISHIGLGSDYKVDDTPLKFDDTGDCVILHFNEAPGTLTFDIKGNSFSGGTFTVLSSANGEDYTELASYTDLGDTQSEEFTSLAANVRYIKWIYTEKDSGNVGLGNIGLTKPAAASTINLTGTLSDGRYWATFFSSSRYTLSEGAAAYTMNASNQLYRLGSDGSIIPANTAVIIISDTADITLTKDNGESAVAVNGGANILLGSDSPVAKYTLPSGKKAYVLGVYSATMGFYEFTGDGIPANKAYYLVNE